MAVTAAYTRIYLSPHLDDAVLSCGGRIWEQTRAGESVAVVTLFAGGPAQGRSLSPYATELHARWGWPADATKERREEDRAALAVLGAEAVHWPYKDCVYRRTPQGGFAYASENALWGRVHPAEESLVEDLAERIRDLPAMPGGALYAPLGAGRHVDHRLARRAAERWGQGLTYYEDYPYAEDWANVEAALGQDGWEMELVPLSGEALEAKTAAIACYRSQVSSFWTGVADMETTVRRFAERTGGGESAERYWIPLERAGATDA